MEIISETVDANGKKHIKVRYTEDELANMKKQHDEYKSKVEELKKKNKLQFYLLTQGK